MRVHLFLILALLSLTCQKAAAAGQAEHVVVVVWDGMRPDFITPQYTPTLFDLANRGAFFANNHSVFISTTEVNGTVLATGMYPDHSGVMANSEYNPDLSWLNSFGTESLDAVRRGDRLTQGHYLGAATVPELLQKAGIPTMVAGAKPIALLHDRAPKKTTQAEKESVTLFRGQTLPRSVLETLVRGRDVGPYPGVVPGSSDSQGSGGSGRRRAAAAAASGSASTASTNAMDTAAVPSFRSTNSVDSWTTKALVNGLWRKGVPKYSLLWLSEPDASQHSSGVGSEAAITALESSDANLALVLKALEDKGVADKTDLLIVSDHGFSTINHGPDILESLKKSKFTAATQFQNPEPGDIMVINLGGCTSFYVFDHDEAVISRLVAFLQGTDFAGVIFSALPIEGTFPLAQVHVGTTNAAPDVLVSMRWTDELNEARAPGMITSIGGKDGSGTHGSLSRFDLHNTLVAAGPDFKKGFVSELPSGNIDVAPTVLFILGVTPSRPMDGRVLYEAMTSSQPPALRPEEKTIEASRDFGFLNWHQYLQFTQMGSTVYYDEGNGACRLKQAPRAQLANWANEHGPHEAFSQHAQHPGRDTDSAQ